MTEGNGKQQLPTCCADHAYFVDVVVFQGRRHVERFVGSCRVSQFVLVRVQVLLCANHREDAAQRVLVVHARHKLLIPRQAHRQSVRLL